MSLKNLIFCLTATSVLAACQSGSSASESEATAVKVENQGFGAAITEDGAIAYPEMLAKLNGADSLAVKVKGRVDAVCQAKGCWMNLSDGKNATAMMVKFKDYGFFVPKDIAGREVVIEGYAYRAVTPVDELRHLAEDAGKSKEEIEAITQPKEELKFLASGVLLLGQ